MLPNPGTGGKHAASGGAGRGDSPTSAAQPPGGGGFMPLGFPVIHNLIRSGLALTPPTALSTVSARSGDAGGQSSPGLSPPLPIWRTGLVNDLLIQLESAH